MHRRDFLWTGAQAAAVGAAVSVSGRVEAAGSATSAAGAPSILKSYTADDHRRRLANLGVCQRAIRSCLRKHLITNYLPAQCCYNLGEYPCRKPWDPGADDERELDRLKEHGIQLIQVFDEWNDSLRLFGGDKYTALNPAGFRRFIEMVHRRGMKILTYTSTGFLQQTDPDFRPDWCREGDLCRVGYWDMARCSPASPGWRAFLLPRIVRILDAYELDGIYIDGGYVQNYRKRQQPPAKDEVVAFEETPHYDGALTDLLALVYAEVKRRGGILKLHVDGADQPRTAGQVVYDYLWVGEGVNRVDPLREAVKNLPPYVVPCIDLSFAKIENEDEQYLHAIPYLQFPILPAGRPFTGERALVPGVKYVSDQDFWMRRCREAWKYYQAHPEGPYTYSGWDAVPGRAETRPTHARWLRQYLPLVEEGTWAWLELGESSLFGGPLPKETVASVFANRELYLVLANYGQAPAEIVTAEAFVRADAPTAKPATRWQVAPRSLSILRRAAVAAKA
jgi:hypothetical protein